LYVAEDSVGRANNKKRIVNNNQHRGMSRIRILPDFLIPQGSARQLAYLLCLGILIPSLSFAAYLLNEMHERELGILHQSVNGRARIAASYFDERMNSLLKTLRELPGTPATATENTYEHIRADLDSKGIVLFTRAQNLDLLSPASGANAAVITIDGAARSAAAAALSKLVPQITPYGVAANGGVNIWLASAQTDNGTAPVLIQARVPAAYLTSAFKNFALDDSWSFSVVGSDGQIYAETSNSALTNPETQVVRSSSLIEGFADTSQFGWKIAAGIPSSALNQTARRNWMAFFALSSLLAVASFAGATLLTRSIIEDENANLLTQASGIPAASDTGKTSHRFSKPTELVENRLGSALRAGHVGIWQWNLKSGLFQCDSEIANILGHAGGKKDQTARFFLRYVEPRDRPRLLSGVRACLKSGKSIAVEIQVRRADGALRWIAFRGAVTEQDGARSARPAVLSGVAYDITDQRLSLSRTDSLLREVSHRSKNLLALILAMARLTARDAVDVKSHLKDFTLRVAGLSASQDLIVASDWQSVDLATLALAEIGAVARTDADRVAVSGPAVSLTPEAAQTLGMVMTELALNAVEHGALSAATGEVRLSWEVINDDTIRISWKETGGLPFVPDGPKGYGTSVVERFSTQGLKLSAHASADADGFSWILSGPLANIGQRRAKEV
jgi:two-component sensor histidine kinase